MGQNGERVTRSDVAKAAGVSETIVSYVMNNNRYVAKEKRQRVEEAIAALHYRPNNVARALKGKRSNQLLFIADQITNEYFSRIVSEMDKYAYEAGFLISLCANRNTPEFVSQIISRQYDGIIISSISFPMEYVESFSKAGIPVLMFEHSTHDKRPENVATIASGLYPGARMAVRHLIGSGRKHIIYIDRISKKGNMSGPTGGYLDEMRENGLSAGEDTIIAGCHSEEELGEEVVKYLKDHKETDGIVGRNDMVACIAMYTAVGWGKRVPQDMGVVGFDNSSISQFCFPRLTTLEMQREAISRAAIDMMVQMIGGKHPENAKFETKLIVREST
ncbi:LacI family DNA-binding transcriptional regulator [Lacrimispora sp.]|uniref:LacI family DNA-binding transcriptional regulator n=1 Tax=Lacrimispora sp. TaxID=2719234 RepID=UPI00289BAC2C|nr:LacI family DNA-binding transcriptional regulator [Lacrimispora sp.]